MWWTPICSPMPWTGGSLRSVSVPGRCSGAAVGGVRSSPHSHLKTLPSGPHTERGPSSTVLSSHSSHTRMTCLDVSATSNPLLHPVGHDRSCRSGRRRPSAPLRVTRPISTSPSAPAGGASRQGGVASTCRSQLELCLEPKVAYICTSVCTYVSCRG